MRILCGFFRWLLLGAVMCLTSAQVARAVTYIQGFDVYSGDGAVNWTSAKNAGYLFAFVKATDGVNFVDSRFAANMQNSAAAGVYVGPYHFCRISSKEGVPFTSYDGSPFAVGSDPWLDATSEAADFIQAIRPYYNSGSYLPPVADVEGLPDFGSTSLNRTFISNWLQLFSDSVLNATGVRPIMYASKSNANTNFTSAIASTHKLWIAWWKGTGTTSPPLQSDTPAWQPWAFWQYSNLGSVPGVPGSEGPPTYDKEDVDVFSGTQAQLTALLVHNVPGDYNHSGTVDAADYIVWRDSRGSTLNLAADGNNNQVVDSADYTFWRSHLGQTSGSGMGSEFDGSAIGVPEPAAISLAFFALIVRAARRAR